ncbi:MAG: hypothetical protein KBS78_02770 [Bacteroidales bacterium]|nr:hypothetical protein [Candidatus Cryptobacteroides faecihippi]
MKEVSRVSDRKVYSTPNVRTVPICPISLVSDSGDGIETPTLTTSEGEWEKQ